MFRRGFTGAILSAVVVSACQAAPPSSAPLTGAWGGEHVGLELAADGGMLEYDCAAGTIDESVRPDASGRFTARGTHTPGHGGPERVGEQAPALPATYEGRVRGARMTLSVHVEPTDARLGPFTLERGAAPMILRCL